MRHNLSSAIYKDAAHQSPGINVFCGAASGALGAAAGSPFFFIKTRLQSYSPFLPVGAQHDYKGAIDGFRKVHASEGVPGLYRGCTAAMVRTACGSSVQLPTYFFAKRNLMRHFGAEDGPRLHLLSSAFSGFAVCCAMHPPDTVMARLYNTSGGVYSGVFDCFYKTITKEGLLAVYKGYFAHLARILPHTVCFVPCLILASTYDSNMPCPRFSPPEITDHHPEHAGANNQAGAEVRRRSAVAMAERADLKLECFG